jgi:ATP-dependent 26S proteasome regulatory subunit
MATDPIDYLSAQLRRLDLLLHREILRLRARYHLSLDEFRGLYISDAQVDALVAGDGADRNVTADDLTRQAVRLREINASELTDELPWKRMVDEFSLSEVEQDVLLCAVAPEIDVKYETIYAYLNNDVTRKWPTCDLASRICAAPTRQTTVRQALLPGSTLFRSGILQTVQSAPDRPSWLASGFSLSPPVAHYLLGVSSVDAVFAGIAEHETPSVEWSQLSIDAPRRAALGRVPAFFTRSSDVAPVVVLEGRAGSGRRSAASAICRDLGVPLLRVSVDALCAASDRWPRVVQAISLHLRLHRAGVYLARGDALFEKDGKLQGDSENAARKLAETGRPAFFECEPGTRWQELFKGRRVLHFAFSDPDYGARSEIWKARLSCARRTVPATDLDAIAGRFVLTAGQIAAAVTHAVDAHRLSTDDSAVEMPSALLFEAARLQSDQSLGGLAVKVATSHGWTDLVLPAATLNRVTEIVAAIRCRHVVYSEWGFEQRIASGKGLKVLFAGASGTGKTMAAGVIAKDLGLDLYKIDLSGVVSKYIGETEKNLDRIFRAAHCSNAILFFDEADALFGRRSEVKDAHDRYANIEVAYLLQKVEDHEGVVILASNLSRNIDDAFSRRMHYVVEFPMPDEQQRERLWRGMFPPQVPLAPDVDFAFLAKQFPLAGGDIRNVVLDAAFLAAEDGRTITMRQIVKAIGRQMMKQGRVPSPADFKQYHAVIMQER